MKISYSKLSAFCFGFITLLVAVYSAEGIQSVNNGAAFSNIKYEILYQLGGISNQLVLGKGDYLRIFSAPLLHVSLEHLFFNCLALLFVGSVVERLIGGSFTAGIFSVSALVGAFFSISINPPNLLSVGASDGILGLVAALGIISLKARHAETRKKLSDMFYQYLIPSLLPIAGSSIDAKIDLAGHLGGAIGGAISAYLLLILVPMKNIRAYLEYFLLTFFGISVLAGFIKILGLA